MNHAGVAELERSGNGRGAAQCVYDLACGSHDRQLALSASSRQAPLAALSIEIASRSAQTRAMLSSADLLRMLEERKIKRSAIAAVMGIDPAGVTRLYDGDRKLTLDEAKRLVEAFNLNGVASNPLSVPIARLLVLYAADALQARLEPEDPRVEELARDLRAFSMFAADPQVRESTEAVQGFFQGLRLAQDRTGEP